MRTLLALAALLVTGCSKRDPASLENQFQESMSGVTLVGKFSGHGDKLHDDKYTIESVSKVAGDIWLFKARIQYEDHDVTLPLPLQVRWAGDTPVITLTDMPIPGFGTFTARVMIYRGEYAGTWRGKKAGGQMFGKIVRTQP